MKIIAYLYINPLLESSINENTWEQEADYTYQDFGQRQQLLQLIQDAQTHPPQKLLIRRLEELGDNLKTINSP